LLVAVVGGKLQGIEAAYLARKAGWDVKVIDKDSGVPASGLGGLFHQLDVTVEQALTPVLNDVDLVIPALENDEALRCLDRWTRTRNIPFAFDSAAYSISSSKLASEQIFSRLGVAKPRPWPGCRFPVVAKPSEGSGSDDVQIFDQPDSVKQHLNRSTRDWIIQEFIDGPSYSLEIIGKPGNYTPVQVTDLGMDSQYDCKRVIAPTDLSDHLILDFETLSISLAEALELKGLIDVEVILHDNRLRVLEIDARLPSQTPTAVYWSTGQNLVQMLGQIFLSMPQTGEGNRQPPQGVVYEHIHVTSCLLEVVGEHIMSNSGALHVCRDFFGADEAITNYVPGREEWVATLIISGKDRKHAWEKRDRVIKEIREKYHLIRYIDSSPDPIELKP
tara:strand:- start:61 stop:1227 length:1167 start_codon:yes stop_codon:yes gene_type:complete